MDSHLTKLALEDDGTEEDLEVDGQTKNTLTFEGTGLETQALIMLYLMMSKNCNIDFTILKVNDMKTIKKLSKQLCTSISQGIMSILQASIGQFLPHLIKTFLLRRSHSVE